VHVDLPDAHCRYGQEKAVAENAISGGGVGR